MKEDREITFDCAGGGLTMVAYEIEKSEAWESDTIKFCLFKIIDDFNES